MGWVGNYRRIEKRFDVAFHVCDMYGYKLRVAGFLNTMLHIPYKKMPDFYRGVDVLLVTSSIEAHPLIVYEALSCEVPVVMMPVGDCYDENIPGIHYYHHEKPGTIARCIETTYEKRVEMGQAGREEVIKRWQWKHWIPCYTEMFQDVAKKRRDISVAIIVDKSGWAWDVMSKIIRHELLKTGFYRVVDVFYIKGIRETDEKHIKALHFTELGSSGEYDVILNHFWHIYNHRSYPNFPHHKNILCANGIAYQDNQWKELFKEAATVAPAITSVSKTIVKDLKEKFGNPIYHCSRGVNVDMFCPMRLMA